MVISSQPSPQCTRPGSSPPSSAPYPGSGWRSHHPRWFGRWGFLNHQLYVNTQNDGFLEFFLRYGHEFGIYSLIFWGWSNFWILFFGTKAKKQTETNEIITLLFPLRHAVNVAKVQQRVPFQCVQLALRPGQGSNRFNRTEVPKSAMQDLNLGISTVYNSFSCRSKSKFPHKIAALHLSDLALTRPPISMSKKTRGFGIAKLNVQYPRHETKNLTPLLLADEPSNGKDLFPVKYKVIQLDSGWNPKAPQLQPHGKRPNHFPLAAGCLQDLSNSEMRPSKAQMPKSKSTYEFISP